MPSYCTVCRDKWLYRGSNKSTPRGLDVVNLGRVGVHQLVVVATLTAVGLTFLHQLPGYEGSIIFTCTCVGRGRRRGGGGDGRGGGGEGRGRGRERRVVEVSLLSDSHKFP